MEFEVNGWQVGELRLCNAKQVVGWGRQWFHGDYGVRKGDGVHHSIPSGQECRCGVVAKHGDTLAGDMR